jgi:hypothetical protein
MRELNTVEIDQVSGGMFEEAALCFATMFSIGASTWGSTWGAVAVGSAIGFAPIAAGAMTGLAIAGGIALTFQ